MKENKLLGWHFIGNKLRDGSPVPEDGVWLPEIIPVVLCTSGYHGSINPFDALQFAPGATLCRCEYSGTIIHDHNKFVASQRRIVARMDATEMLRYFARMQAVSVVHLWQAPDVVLDWLMTGHEGLQAAAYAAAQDAAWDAAWAAARDAAYAAAQDAAWDAARDAAWATACAAAWDAARDAFVDLVTECFGLEDRT
jgi:hypothetical protein